MRRIDWSHCPLAETDPARLGGRPVLRGTRMPVDDIVANAEYGVSVDEIGEQFGLAVATVRGVLAYAEGHEIVARLAG